MLDNPNRFLHNKPIGPGLLSLDREFLVQFELVLEEHGCELEFTTSIAAGKLGISRMHLNRRLRALTGKSTHALILERRLEVARTLLTQPLPVGFVAMSVGFNSFSHFAKAFRRNFGMTPSCFRARQLQILRSATLGGAKGKFVRSAPPVDRMLAGDDALEPDE